MHSVVIVIGNDNLEDAMAPFNEEIEVPKYYVGDVDDVEKERCLNYYNARRRENGLSPYNDFDECYAENAESWNSNHYEKDENGVWQEFSTWNPQAHWDWYEVGGRWAGKIRLKEGVERLAPINFSWGWSEEKKIEVNEEKPVRADIAYLKDIANVDELLASDVILFGEWITLSDWEFKPIAQYLKDLPGDTLITCVDYHC